MKLSVIIPCYNVEKYIRRCLDSVLSINLPLSEYEVICFDDKSPDATSAILDEYENTFCNVHIIHSAINVGPGGGRNKASQIAQGDYLWFVDADDMIVSEGVPELLEQVYKNGLDVLIFDYQDIDEDRHLLVKGSNMKDTDVMNGREIGNMVFSGGLVNNMGYPVRFLLKKSYMAKHHITFPENMTYGEDTVWMAKVVLFAERIQSSSICAYLYWHHETSTCGQLNKIYPGKTIYERCFVAASQLLEFVCLLRSKSGNGWNEYALEIENFTKSHYVNRLPLFLCRTSALQRASFYQQVKKYPDRVAEIYSYFNRFSKILLQPVIGPLFAHLLSAAYKLMHKK